eukprot:gene8403-17322_t
MLKVFFIVVLLIHLSGLATICSEFIPDSCSSEGMSCTSKNGKEDIDKVKGFFDAYSAYRNAVDGNCIYHVEAYAALDGFLDSHVSPPFSFMDLGCGDAIKSSEVLSHKQLTQYHGVDISTTSLEIARNSTSNLQCVKTFSQADFLEEVIQESDKLYDVIFVGLSVHHLPLHDKEKFFHHAHNRISPSGYLIIFEPVFSSGETRDDYYKKSIGDLKANCTTLIGDQLDSIVDHILTHDYPEEIQTYENIAKATGFSSTETIFLSDMNLYAVMAFHM